MLYQRQSFTCPAAGNRTSQQQWDLAFLTKEEFTQKYNVSDATYAQLCREAQ